VRRLGPSPLGVAYVPKGPILDYGDPELVERVLDDVESLAREKHALFVKVDPDVRKDTAAGQGLMDVLRRRGWRVSDEQIQYRNTMMVDLTLSEEVLLSEMKSKWRYNVRLAKRKGVEVRRGTLADLPLLYEMYEETAERGEFVIRPEEYYEQTWETFMRADMAQPFIAEVEEEPVAMVVIYRFAGTAYYVHGASRSVHRDKMPNHRLQWEAMTWAKEQGCDTYDMWGAPDELDESDPMWGVYRFKKGFGAEFVEHVGAWDRPISRVGTWVYSQVMPRVLAVMRWLHWRRAE